MVKGQGWIEYALKIGEIVMAGVCECHITNAKGVILSKGGERIAWKNMSPQILYWA